MTDFLLAVNTHMSNNSLQNIYIGAFEISKTSFALKFFGLNGYPGLSESLKLCPRGFRDCTF